MAWAITFYYYLRKSSGKIGAGVFIVLTYLIYAIISYFLYNDDNAGLEFGKMELFPFVYLFLMLLIFLQPVLQYNEKCIIQHPSRIIMDSISYLFIISAIIIMPTVIEMISSGLFLIITDEAGGEELYFQSHLGIKDTNSVLFNVFKFTFLFLGDFAILLIFYYLSLPQKKKNTWIIYGLFFSIIMLLFESFGKGQRTRATMTFLLLFSTFFLFRDHLSANIKKRVKQVGFVLSIPVLATMLLINNSRFSDSSSGGTYKLLYYIGHANLYFNKYAMDAGGIRYGDRTCNKFKSFLQFNDVPSGIQETRNKYSNMKVSDASFYTYVGDFCLDFGPTGAAILLCSCSVLFTFLTHPRKNKILFHQLLLVFFVMTICVQGGMYLFYYSFSGNYTIFIYIILYFVFKFDYDRNTRLKHY